MAANGQQLSYACKCLNVRLSSRPPPSTALSADDPYISVYVGDDGINVTHTRVTLRTRSKPLEQKDGESSQWSRYTSVTCLICQTLAYRVHQAISPDLDSAEGPVLPTDEWAEQEVLRSTTGWIEVHKDCLSGEAITKAELSPSFSLAFRIVLPSRTVPSQDANTSSPVQTSAPGSPSAGTHHLPPLPPLFLPPPFTPAHPVFTYLSQVALSQSQKLRDAAEEYIARVTEEKTKEVLAAESRLKNEVEVLWVQFGESVEAAERSGASSSVVSRRRQSSARKPGPSSPAPGIGTFAASSSVRINGFVPSPVPPLLRASSQSPRQVTSALSTSLRESSFHFPQAAQSGPAEPSASASHHVNGISRAHVDAASRSVALNEANEGRRSPSTSSSRTAAVVINGANGDIGSVRDVYRRNMDQSVDAATSYRYFEMEARIKEEQERQQRTERTEGDATPSELDQVVESVKPTDGISESAIARGRSPKVSKSAIKKPKGKEKAVSGGSPSSKARSSSTGGESSPKSKRKVKFVVKPDVTIIATEDNSEAQDQADTMKNEEPMFDMETETGLRDKGEGTVVNVMPPVVERPQAPQRAINGRKKKAAVAGSLPASLSSLWPSSLPNLSTISSPPPADTIPRIAAAEAEVARRSEANGTITNCVKTDEADDEELDPREAELLRLVAASTPSHRAAWRKDGRAWQLFISRQGRKSGDEGILEEDEEEDTSTADSSKYQTDDSDLEEEVTGVREIRRRRGGQWSYYEEPIASSLPIPINFRSRNKQTMGVPSYQPKTSLSDRPGMLVPPLKVSANAMRKATYAERDRERDFDPGALDFDLEDVTEEDETETENDASPEVGSVGRKRALKILQAREALPPAGMWRSLAS